MNKIYSFIVAMILGVIGFATHATEYTITVNVNDASLVKATTYDSNWNLVTVDLVDGDNVLTYPEYTYVQMNPVDGCLFTDVTCDVDEEYWWSASSFSIGFNSAYDGATIAVVVANAEDLRTASFTLVVDDPDAIEMKFDTNYEPEIVAGENVISFIPGLESSVSFARPNSSAPFYQFIYNEEEILPSYGSYYVDGLEDGDKIEITAVFPEDPQPVQFVFGEGAEGCVRYLKINDEKVYDFTADDFTVNLGTEVKIYINNSLYSNFSGSINDEEIGYMYSGYPFIVMGPTVVNLEAVKKECNLVTLTVDNPEAVIAYDGYAYEDNVLDLSAGSLQFEMAERSTIEIRTVDGYMLNQVTCVDADDNTNTLRHYNTYVYLTHQLAYGDCTYNVTTGTLEELRTATAKVTVDDASKVKLQLVGGAVELQDGENEVKFIPDLESTFEISHVEQNSLLASVTHNGENCEYNYMNVYQATNVQDGDEINIIASFPEGNATVNITYADEISQEAILYINVNRESIDYTPGESFEVAYGSKISIALNSSGLKFKQFIVNGEEYEITEDDYYFTIVVDGSVETYDIYVEAAAFGEIPFTINVDNAEAVFAYYYGYDAYVYPLVNGDNEVAIPENSNALVIQPASQLYNIVSVKDGEGNEIEMRWGQYEVEITEGMTLYVTTSMNVFDNVIMAYHSAGDFSYFTLYSSDYMIYEDIYSRFDNGATYRRIAFDDTDATLNLQGGLNDEGEVHVYINDEEVDLINDYSYSASDIKLTDGDVLKVYAFKPASCPIEVDDKYNLAAITLDRIKAVETADLNVLEGTEVQIASTSDLITLDVEVEGLGKIEANADGYYVFIASPTTTKIKVGEFTSIEGVAVDKVDNNVYNMQGILVVKNATEAQINALPAGLYIINGKKIAIR